MFERLKDGLQTAIHKILGAPTLDEQAINEFVKDLQRTLLQADVNVKLVFDLSARIQKRALEEKPPPGLPRKDQIVKILYDELSSLMGSESKLDLPFNKTNIILMVGIQGSGKTTVTAKLARLLSKRGYKVGVVCADTFRPGALSQLKMLCDVVKVDLYGDEQAKESVEISLRGVTHFTKIGKNCVIVDTAGRHKEEKGLMEEMAQISSKIHPETTILVLDGTIGQAAYSQSQAFHEAVPLGGIVVTKLDGAAKGGGALAAAAATGSKILFIGTGERVDDLEVFSPTRFVGRLLGLGDIQALLERARELEMEADEKKMKRVISGKMTINDFYYQIEQVKKMGSLRKVLELIPGFGSAIPAEGLEGLEDQIKRWRNIIQSMTKAERNEPGILNSSRMRRIARGSGSTEREVKEMLTRFKQTKAMMKATGGRQFKQLLRRLQST